MRTFAARVLVWSATRPQSITLIVTLPICCTTIPTSICVHSLDHNTEFAVTCRTTWSKQATASIAKPDCRSIRFTAKQGNLLTRCFRTSMHSYSTCRTSAVASTRLFTRSPTACKRRSDSERELLFAIDRTQSTARASQEIFLNLNMHPSWASFRYRHVMAWPSVNSRECSTNTLRSDAIWKWFRWKDGSESSGTTTPTRRGCCLHQTFRLSIQRQYSRAQFISKAHRFQKAEALQDLSNWSAHRISTPMLMQKR